MYYQLNHLCLTRQYTTRCWSCDGPGLKYQVLYTLKSECCLLDSFVTFMLLTIKMNPGPTILSEHISECSTSTERYSQKGALIEDVVHDNRLDLTTLLPSDIAPLLISLHRMIIIWQKITVNGDKEIIQECVHMQWWTDSDLSDHNVCCHHQDILQVNCVQGTPGRSTCT